MSSDSCACAACCIHNNIGIVPVSTVLIIGEFIMSISCLCSFPSTGEGSISLLSLLLFIVSHL